MLPLQMKSSSLMSRLLAVLCALVLLVPAWAGADERESGFRPFDQIVVFGTSLSDPGNAFALTRISVSAPTYGMSTTDGFPPSALTLIPNDPYAIGGNRFSNGPTWVEQLARPLGLAWSVKPAYVQSIDGSSNYAVGGARARDGVAGEVSLSQQVNNFLRDARGQASPRALYVIEMGGNDVRDALGGDPTVVIPQALAAVAQAIGTLHYYGARKFLIWNVPDLGLAPAIVRIDQFYQATYGTPPHYVTGNATAAAAGYNAALTQILDGLSAALPGIDIARFDAFTTLQTIAGHPLRYALRNATDACIAPFTPLPSRCATPDRYFFWDGIHPTRAGHAIIAIENGKALIGNLLVAH